MKGDAAAYFTLTYKDVWIQQIGQSGVASGSCVTGDEGGKSFWIIWISPSAIVEGFDIPYNYKLPTSTSSTNMSLLFVTTESSSYDSHSCSEEAALSHYQKFSEEAGILHCKQLLEGIPEDGRDHTNINTLIQRADSHMLELFGKELAAMIDQSIQGINSKHGQAQASDMHRLLKLAGVMTMLPPSSDLLPSILRLYMTLKSFPIDQVNVIASELKRCVREILEGLCSLVQSGLYIVPQGDGIHKTTSYMMNYIKYLWEHNSLLNIILAQDGGESKNSLHGEKWTQLDYFVQSLIGHLDSLLERISKYNSKELQHFFLLNNSHFILEKLQKLDMKSPLQHSWITKYHNQVEYHIMRYLEHSWKPILSCLDTRNIILFPCFHLPPVTRFYTMLTSTCAEQKYWKIEDPELRQVVRKTVSSQVTQCYQAYLERNVKHQKHAPCTYQELENKLMELFEGKKTQCFCGHHGAKEGSYTKLIAAHIPLLSNQREDLQGVMARASKKLVDLGTGAASISSGSRGENGVFFSAC
uniref:Exocyst subunit Exo70 family protein n=2 Tax=Leersia perrieri TaxID=77586 RepID=A0A0D9WWS5_9ORYZ